MLYIKCLLCCIMFLLVHISSYARSKCIDSIEVKKERLYLFSGGRKISLKFHYNQGVCRAKYKDNTFTTVYDTAYGNTNVDTVIRKMKLLSEYSFGEPMKVLAGYILHDSNNVYFINRNSTIANWEYVFSKMCLDKGKRKYYLTFVHY